ncbi:alpha-hydroxyketone-type quorum-sensing autoinducer synthase [Streptomyces candidus]|uniref:8-amino-7-oxononanoate synthase n=1 Tax=Streptomyces candidus TaxID=67283 RepID=A0A7X0LPQ5_9ACTN|nr:alpha-hydroxyketone-type quorum-sensing autoinducer synthase [Streptomyces candidus]MBB6436768.1 CAI-1 autoinducer synthase [Streptomyces candidus]GHH51330.1 CAI-1 autoinducer synthase [Streptomyces candidus]
MSGELSFLQERLQAWNARQASWGGPLYRGRPTPRNTDLTLMSNDYLAIGGHPAVLDAQVRSLRAQGNGALMSGVFTGDSDPLRRLEADLAHWLGAPSVMLSQSGWSANVGLIQAVCPAGGSVYVDELAHASLWEGISAAHAVARPFAHNDTEHLERTIRQHGPGLIAFDTLYSVTGDLCPLPDLTAVARRTGCDLIADESHTLGVLGPQGGGLVPSLGLTDAVAYRTASLAKAFAGRAGLIACSPEVAGYLPYHSLGAVFSSTLLPHDVAGLSAALGVLRTADDRRERLEQHSRHLRDGLTALGYHIAPSESQIIPLQPGTEPGVRRLQQALDARGVFGAAFVPPSVPVRRCVHRLSVHSELAPADLDRVLDACAAVRDEVGLREWRSTRRLPTRRTAAVHH